MKINILKDYLALPWVKVIVWITLTIVGLLLIAAVANYLTVSVFHF